MNNFIITGKVHEGKTTYASELVNKLKNKGALIGGFLSLGFFKKNKRNSFDIKFLSDDSSMLLAKRGFNNNTGYYFGEYNFNPYAFQYASNEFKNSIDENVDFIFLDEVGKYELLNGGFIDILNYIKSNKVKSNIVCVTRENFVEEVNRTFFDNNATVINISEPINSTVELLMKYKNNNE